MTEVTADTPQVLLRHHLNVNHHPKLIQFRHLKLTHPLSAKPSGARPPHSKRV